MVMDKLEFVERIFGLYARLDIYGSLFWHGKLDRIFINCSDLFFWGCADSEEITEENLPRLETLAEELEAMGKVKYPRTHSVTGEVTYGDLPATIWIEEIFCARERQMRPQGACYERWPQEIRDLCNAAGPPRDIDFGNPFTQEQEYEYKREEES